MLWRNPHAYFSVRADGVVWEIETSSLTVLKRLGIEPGHDPRRRPCARRSEPARRRQEGDVRAARAAAGRPRVALERRAQAALDERRPCRRRRIAAHGARRRRFAPRPRHFSCLEPHAHHRALVSRSDGSNRRHQRLSADAGRARAARGVRSQHRQSDGELRAEGHADDHGGAVSDRVRAPGRRRHPAQARGIRSRRGTYI